MQIIIIRSARRGEIRFASFGRDSSSPFSSPAQSNRERSLHRLLLLYLSHRMADSRVLPEPHANFPRSGAGIISRIRLENFMCHSSLQIELGDWVNFITGQNGSGKSAILTAICIAFGCRAKSTQRANTLKDFIKIGCSYASIIVEIKNEGEDAFMPEKYGNMIILERRISESGSSIFLKDHQGRKVAQRSKELVELVEYFNIDVDNPCVIMSQDKSREFLHSGNDKDKFKFFFKATLLQQVSELLEGVQLLLDNANDVLRELESSISPIIEELKELHEKIKNMEHVEEIGQEVQLLKKKLAWSWVYDVDRQIEEQKLKLEKLKDRVPTCQTRIDHLSVKVNELKVLLDEKKAHITTLMEKTFEVRGMKEEIQNNILLAKKQRDKYESEHSRGCSLVAKLRNRVRLLEQQIRDAEEQHMKDTQAEEVDVEEQTQKLQDEINMAQNVVSRLQEEENELSERLSRARDALKDLGNEVKDNERKYNGLCSQLHALKQQLNKQENTAFKGGLHSDGFRISYILIAFYKQVQEDIKSKELILEQVLLRMNMVEAKASDLKRSFENLCDSANVEIDGIEGAERELYRLSRKSMQLRRRKLIMIE
ncbi:hypothetical protein HPP92_027283 [Vanilla planifolia]|uniref:Rad50/SbcC-type AAA domain-containing protein n=1 Tax=Vanilla planifolia TaxID=51239 RepID=A0A835U5Z7_VANPL|nr:hypothetical protein HPP92_027283 [Vanilla planifolia]